jgi:hypothetical protein
MTSLPLSHNALKSTGTQGVPHRQRRVGERKRKSIRGCIVGQDIAVLAATVAAGSVGCGWEWWRQLGCGNGGSSGGGSLAAAEGAARWRRQLCGSKGGGGGGGSLAALSAAAA